MRLKVLSSGSHGNSYLLITPTGTLILDCGINFRLLQKGLNFDLSGVLGCLVTHEHKDHSKAILDVMKAGIDCYMSNGTALGTGIRKKEDITIKYHRAKMIKSANQFKIKDYTILPFETEHDAEEPLGFLIQYNPTKEKLLFITDSYYSKYKFKGLNYILIECNYIKETLDENIAAGRISEAMKPRLLRSHFSLDNVLSFFKANDLSQCREIVLLHLSDSNSDAERMVKEIHEAVGIRPVVADAGLELDLKLYPY